MKAFIILAFVGLIASVAPLKLTEEQEAKVKVIFQECVKQENVPEDEATRLRNKDLANPTQNMKCFGACFFEKIGALKDGVVQDEVVLEKLAPQYGEEQVKDVLKKCKDIKGADRCDTGYKIYECFKKAQAAA